MLHLSLSAPRTERLWTMLLGQKDIVSQSVSQKDIKYFES